MINDSQEHNNFRINHDPEHAEMESLLDLLAQQDRDAMPTTLESRVMDEVSKVIAPTPIAFTPIDITRGESQPWSMRIAAAAVLAIGTTLVIVSAQPWATSPASSPEHEITVASLSSHLDEYFSLESVDDGQITEAITDWEIWAQSIDTDLYTDNFDYSDILSDDGEL